MIRCLHYIDEIIKITGVFQYLIMTTLQHNITKVFSTWYSLSIFLDIFEKYMIV